MLLLALLLACGHNSKDNTDDDGPIDGVGDGTSDGTTDGTTDGSDDGATDGTGTGGGTGSGTGGGGAGGGTTGSGDGSIDTAVPPDTGWGGTDAFDASKGDISALPCEDALVFQAELWTATGGACTTCPAGEDLYVVGMVANPCDADLELTTSSDYLVSSLDIMNHTTGEGMGMAVGSTGAPSATWTVPAHSYVLESFNVGRMGVGDYKVGVSFADRDAHTAASTARVE